jgi:F-box/leucine-rich repeat protein 7
MAAVLNDASPLVDCKIGEQNMGNSDRRPLRKIFVANFSGNITDWDLRRLFSMFGLVVDAHVLRDRVTHAKKKFGFVTYKYPQDAVNVLRLRPGKLRLESRNLFVAEADRWHQPIELSDGTVLWRPNSRGGAETGECKIDMLNDDCLMHIFSFLPMRERVKVERVCKRWQMASLAAWVGQKHLDFQTAFPDASVAVLNTHILQAGLKRCGRFLERLNLSREPNSLDESALGIVASTCKRLRYLHLGHVPVTSGGLRSLWTVSHQLITLCLDECSGIVDEDLQNVFIHSPNLESVTVCYNSELTGQCLFGLEHVPLRELVLEECENLEEQNLMDVLPLLQGLIRLNLNGSVTELISNVHFVIGALPNLQSLSMCYFHPFSSDALTPLEPLSSLLTLNLKANPFVNDEVIEAISRSCHRIEELDISDCNLEFSELDTVTEYGYMCLSQLPNLVRLHINVSEEVSNEALEVIASRGKLQMLACNMCSSVTEVGCISVITLCKHLEYFDIRGCNVEPFAVLQATAEAVKHRPCDSYLTVLMKGIEHHWWYENVADWGDLHISCE